MKPRNLSLKPTHPGAVLREDVLLALEMTQTEFARRLGVSRQAISELLNEKRALTPDMAERVAKFLNTTPESWLRMQEAVDDWNLTPHEKEILDSLVDQMHKTSEEAISAIDSALDFVDASNKRIAKMESQKNKQQSVTALKGVIAKPVSPVSIAAMNKAIISHGKKTK